MKFKIVNYFLFLVMLGSKLFCQNLYQDGCKAYYSDKNEIAIELFTKSIDSKQEVSKSFMMRGATKIYQGKFVEALSDLRSSLDIDSTYYKTYFYYGKVYLFQGFYNTAIKYYNISLLKYDKDPAIYDDLAIAKVKLGDFDGAIKDEEKAIFLDSNKPDYFINKAFAELNLKQYEQALNDINLSLKMGNDPKSYSIKGTILASLGNHVDAIKCFNVAIEKMPDAVDLYYYRGLSFKSLGNIKDACSDFHKSFNLGYKDSETQLNQNCIK